MGIDNPKLHNEKTRTRNLEADLQAEMQRQRGLSTLLPLPTSTGMAAQQERYLKHQAEVVLRELVNQLRSGELTLQSAACGLGRITGYYDLLAEITREQQRHEREREALTR